MLSGVAFAGASRQASDPATLIDRAVAALKATTISYPAWQQNATTGKYADVITTKWWQVFDLLRRAKLALPVPPASPSPSGQAMPVGDLAGWHQVFTDDFTTSVSQGSFPSAVATKWSAY